MAFLYSFVLPVPSFSPQKEVWFSGMPRGTKDPPRLPVETPDGLRTMAAHARRLARNAGDDEAAAKLMEFAEELEAKAATFETAPQTFSHDEAAKIDKIEDDTEPDA